MTTIPTTTPTKYMLMALTPPYVVLSNNDQVKQTDIPRTWDDAVSEKWRGKTGHWMRASFFVGLLPALGEDKARDLVTKLAALKPRLFDGQFPLAQAIGSGEIAQGIVAYDSAIRIVEKGPPVTMTSIEPSTLSTICGSVLKHGRNPNTARLSLAWLATPEGAIKFESETKRGNYFVEGTQTRKRRRRLSLLVMRRTLMTRWVSTPPATMPGPSRPRGQLACPPSPPGLRVKHKGLAASVLQGLDANGAGKRSRP